MHSLAFTAEKMSLQYIYIQKACFRSEIGIFNLEEFSARNCAVVTPFWFLLALHVVVAFADGADRLVLKH